jgi:thiamine biosynthesis protein ThiI
MPLAFYRGPAVVLRIGELFLKRGNRRLFEDALARNLGRALAGRDGVRLVRAHGRMFVLGAADEDLLARLRWVFGLSSVSPIVLCEKRLDAITAQALELSAALHVRPGATFRIVARRSDKGFPADSCEIGRVVGAAVAERTGLAVDLEEPDFRVGVEVGPNWAFVWSEERPGGGGLPVGVSGRAALLLSGGIDSPVAGHLLQKRGLELACVYFHAYPYTGDGAKDKVLDLARALATRQDGLPLFVVPFAKIQERLKDGPDPAYLVILYRRAMVRIAERIAAGLKIGALATGESLGQVASQTLPNIVAIEDAATLPILRPLLGFDKAETIEIARRIGTYDISIRGHEDCCTLFVPRHPQTKGSVARARRLEDLAQLGPLLDEAGAAAERIVL